MDQYREALQLIKAADFTVLDLESTCVKTDDEHIIAMVHHNQQQLGLKRLTDQEAIKLWRLFGNDREFQEITGFWGTGSEWYDFFHKHEDAEAHARLSEAYPGFQAFLMWLDMQGKALQILTNTSYERAERLMPLLGLEGIPLLALGGPPRLATKPHPYGLHRVMTERGFTRYQTVMIGDSRGDAGMADACGVPFIWFKEDGNNCAQSAEVAAATFSSWEKLLQVTDDESLEPSQP